MAPKTPLVVLSGQAALNDVEKRKPGLGNQTLQDYINAGFKIDASTAADLATIRAMSPTDYARIRALFDNPGLVQADIIGHFQPGTTIGGPVSTVGTQVGNLPGGVAGDIGQGLHSTFSPLGGIASTLSALGQANTWIRIGEAVVGIVLIGIGISAITKSTPIGASIKSGVTKVAKVVPK